MRVMLSYIAPLAGAVAAAFIAVAPVATAAPASSQSTAGADSSTTSGPAAAQSCIGLGGTQSQCQSPGNAQINDSPPQVDYYPYGGGGT
jgi:hypothetical protein